ncbi:NAD(P)-dependent oxidoreductase [Dyadobacter sp. CY312]|uniref:NAD(P)-dependent oxidoreductase n=1 Tax=Dyadobacter sp. CY312 TaxID=2907303 RepID=UPI001F187BA5|nr:NAD(P)-dependent oxidoreductase [Dyadobacter sp. CY312]MCE7039339.1 NAD(P)-dependent oxidoreductase [Dyadobacter sp. CY312]
MKIALIGATGFVGALVLTELTKRGHQVTAIARDITKIDTSNEHVNAVKADVSKEEELIDVLKGHDAVVSAYNAGWTNPDLYNQFLTVSQTIQSGVTKAGVKRLLVIGGAGSLEVAPGLQLVDTPKFPEAYKAGAGAARDYLNILKKDTHLDWTFLSPAIEMHPGTSHFKKGTYRTGLDNPVFDDKGKSVIAAEDLAVAIVDELESPKFVKQRFTVGY